MKILESLNCELENVVEHALSVSEMEEINAGWCFILFCSINFSSIFGGVFTVDTDSSPDTIMI